MRFIWDEAKRLANLRKHGIDFLESENIFAGFILTSEDQTGYYCEYRFRTLGLLNEKVVSVIHTISGDSIRIISIRKATRHEQKFYVKELPAGLPDRLGASGRHEG